MCMRASIRVCHLADLYLQGCCQVQACPRVSLSYIYHYSWLLMATQGPLYRLSLHTQIRMVGSNLTVLNGNCCEVREGYEQIYIIIPQFYIFFCFNDNINVTYYPLSSSKPEMLYCLGNISIIS